MTPLTLEPVDPRDEEALRAWFVLELAAQPLDRLADPPPCWTAHRARLTHPRPGRPATAWLCLAGGTVVGAVEIALPTRDNLGSGTVELLVGPAFRRRGVGRALLTHALEQIRGAGRVRVVAETRTAPDGTSPATSFAQATGFRPVLVEVHRVLDLGAVAPVTHERLAARAAAASPGYRLVGWTGQVPEEWLAELARLTSRMTTDAPLGELDWEPEVHDADRMRERDAMCAGRGITLTTSAAVGPDGRLAGFSELGTEASTPWHAHTWNTLVDPAHRGRRLGLRVKLATLQRHRARFPAVHTVNTWNAASNRHMIAVNTEIGFRAVDGLVEHQLDLAP